MVILDKEDFRNAVHEIVRLIPKGRATSYGAIAKAVGYPNMSRMVGAVMSSSNSMEKEIPAHRVVNSQGYLSGSFSFETPTLMQELLESEGVVVRNNKICNWKKVFWNPLDEIEFEKFSEK